MISVDPKTIADEYGFHTWLVHNILEGITHEESLLLLPFETNSMNWVLGHIVTNRSHALEVTQLEHAWRKEVRALYHTGTPNINPGDKAIHIETLLAYLDESAGLLQSKLGTVNSVWMKENFTNYRGEKPREVHLTSFHWHEGFHIGQLEIFKDFVITRRKSG